MDDQPHDLPARLTEMYTPPQHGIASFNCPHCSALALQVWHELEYTRPGPKTQGYSTRLHTALVAADHRKYMISTCAACRRPAFWLGDRLLHPRTITAPLAPEDLPADCRRDYDEARTVVQDSPRAASALLRGVLERVVAKLQKLDRVSDLNAAIGALAAAGTIRPRLKDAMDALRVIGNGMVHAGSLDKGDTADTAQRLFRLVLVLVHDAITVPREVDEAMGLLPPEKVQGIKQRDAQAARKSGSGPPKPA